MQPMKEIFDRAVAVLLVIFLLPLFCIIALLILITQGRPILFKQSRPGRFERIFTIYKFRTMHNPCDNDVEHLSDSLRITRIGRLLRVTSIDELPQLFNIIKGDMSFVGPRALLVEYLPLYSTEQKVRHNVKPGITGWAQVNGRNSISWEEKFDLDVWYVINHSIWLDIKILFLTIYRVLKRSGIAADNSVSMPKFMGSDKK